MSTRDELQMLETQIKAEREGLIDEFNTMFHDQEYDQIKSRLNELKYVERILEAISEKEMAMM